MEAVWPQLVLVAVLVVLNGVLSGSEMALISLRDSQLVGLEAAGGSGRAVARLARNPNRFLATIQVGITLAGFLASAAAAVTLSEPLAPYLGVFGEAADTMAIVVVTLVLSFFTLVFGELAPKRLALQRSESWAKVVARPLEVLAIATRPVVWLLSISTDVVVRLLGGEPGAMREEVDLKELKDLVMVNRHVAGDHQDILVGALEVADRTLRQVLIPRPDVFHLDGATTVDEAVSQMVDTGHFRAPVAPGGSLDEAVGLVNMRDLVRAGVDGTVADHVTEIAMLPESLPVLLALRHLQDLRQQLALVIDEHGGVAGIVTIEDLIEELVGEIYDESDPQVRMVSRQADGSLLVSGRFPVHDLVDVGVEVPSGTYTTVAGLVLDTLGEVPSGPGVTCRVGEWELEVLAMDGRAIETVRFRPVGPEVKAP